MQVSKNKVRFSIALTLLLVASMLFVAVPNVNSQVVDRQITLLIGVAPNPVGVGQSMQILCWADIYPNVYIPANNSLYTGGSSAATYPRYHGYKFTITRPDGTTETKTFTETDPLGSDYFNYVPSQTGTYTVSCYYPGESFVNDPSFRRDATFSAATSRTVSFVVQEAPIPLWNENPLPTGYWARPIDAGSRTWASIASNWESMSQGGQGKDAWSNFQRFGIAPNSAHVLWANVFDNGGLVGGDLTENGFLNGESYQGRFRPIILNGKLYSNLKIGPSITRGHVCYDLRTGEELYRNNDTTVNMGFIFSLQWENAHGSMPFLIQNSGSTMNFLDPRTGELAFSISNAITNGGFVQNNTAGVSFTNDLTEYVISGRQLILWSFYKTVQPTSGFGWNPTTSSNYDWRNGIVYNVTLPKPDNSGNYGFASGGGIVDGRNMVLRSVNNTLWPPTLYLAGIRCSDGQVMWQTSTKDLADPGIWRGGGGIHMSSDGGVYLNFKKETMQVIGWDLTDGSVKYTTEPRNASDWGSYTSGWPIDSAYGKFYVGAYDGYIMAYDLETGNLVWQYSSGNAGFETPYGTYPFFLGIPYGMYIADGKIFAMTGEHSPNDPLYRGERLHVIDAETGEGVWNILGWYVAMGIADGEIVGYNCYDGRVYAFGKGPSAVTVSAPETAATVGTPIVIKGTVMDISPGNKEYTQFAMLPNGVPAVSDASMTKWMEYLWMQQPLPSDATGVEVSIDVFDSNGNYRNIGTTTSDINGFYTFSWQPDIPGDFLVVASFHGTESYYPSYAETSFTAVSAPVVTPVETPVSNTDAYIMYSAVAIIVAVAIVGIVIVLVVRKRP